MKASNLHAVNANNASELPIETVTKVKALDSQFQSFGDALFSWTNSTGFEEPDNKSVNSDMVLAFCRALAIPFAFGNTKAILSSEHYFESDAWFFSYIEEKGYIRMGQGSYVLLDNSFRPIVWIDIGHSLLSNVSIEFAGAEHLVLEFRALVEANVKTDAEVEKKATYAEVIISGGPMGLGAELRVIEGKIENKRTAQPEYYPYLDGGIEALLKDFIESEESVLILMGPPGTGKSSLVAAGVEALDLLPIYAKRADAILDKNFVSFVFGASDTYMAKIAGTAAKARSDLFVETLTKEREFKAGQPLLQKNVDEEAPRVPIIVVEDADMLLAPRSSGNMIMPQLLNETDGIGSNHTRKIVFTTNLSHTRDIDEALMRAGRCYEVVNCRLLTPKEAVAARWANGLPEFEVMPTNDISLAEALRKPRKKISISNGKAGLGFN
jgi:hypothetical protein